jgi:hypothetical protein
LILDEVGALTHSITMSGTARYFFCSSCKRSERPSLLSFLFRRIKAEFTARF